MPPYSGELQPHKQVIVDIEALKANVDVPYTADVVVGYADGHTEKFKDHGMYQGAHAFEINITVNEQTDIKDNDGKPGFTTDRSLLDKTVKLSTHLRGTFFATSSVPAGNSSGNDNNARVTTLRTSPN